LFHWKKIIWISFLVSINNNSIVGLFGFKFRFDWKIVAWRIFNFSTLILSAKYFFQMILFLTLTGISDIEFLNLPVDNLIQTHSSHL